VYVNNHTFLFFGVGGIENSYSSPPFRVVVVGGGGGSGLFLFSSSSSCRLQFQSLSGLF